MPIIPSIIAADIRAASTFSGSQWGPITEAIGVSIFEWAAGNPLNVLMVGSTVGVTGTGMVMGKVMLPPAPGLVVGAFTSTGMTGTKSAEMATAVSLGVSNAINKAGMYQGASAGVGLGTDISKVVLSNAPALIGLIIKNLRAFTGGGGATTEQLATALGNGIAANVALAFTQGVGVSTGSVSPVPLTAISPLSTWV